MSDELRDKVKTAMAEVFYASTKGGPFPWYKMSDAAIALIRNEVLEEAAKEFEEYAEDNRFKPSDAAAAIRALKERT